MILLRSEPTHDFPVRPFEFLRKKNECVLPGRDPRAHLSFRVAHYPLDDMVTSKSGQIPTKNGDGRRPLPREKTLIVTCASHIALR